MITPFTGVDLISRTTDERNREIQQCRVNEFAQDSKRHDLNAGSLRRESEAVDTALRATMACVIVDRECTF